MSRLVNPVVPLDFLQIRRGGKKLAPSLKNSPPSFGATSATGQAVLEFSSRAARELCPTHVATCNTTSPRVGVKADRLSVETDTALGIHRRDLLTGINFPFRVAVAHTLSMSQQNNAFDSMSRDGLLRALEMFAKNWLAHDGCWFLTAEERFGMEAAIELDSRSWKRFAAAEAQRIMTTFNIPEAGGLQALERALSLRLYAVINSQRMQWSADRKHLRFFMDVCRVQETRRRKSLPDFPCKDVGMIEFETFAARVDPRIRTTSLHCPPESGPGQYCGWEFTID